MRIREEFHRLQGIRQRFYAADDYATPYEILRSLPDSHRFLKDGRRWEQLDRSPTPSATPKLRAA